MSKVQSVEPPGQIGLVSDGLGLWALWSHDAGDDPETAVRYIRADLHEARIRELEAERDEAYVRGYHDCQQKGITEGRLALIDGPELLAAKARIRELEAALRVMGVDPGSLAGEGE